MPNQIITTNQNTKPALNKAIGMIKWFAQEKCFGVISLANSKVEVFIHIVNWEKDKDPKKINEKQIVIFEIGMRFLIKLNAISIKRLSKR